MRKMSGTEHNLTNIVNGYNSVPELPNLNSSVCIRNRAARESWALETCHIGRVIRNFKIDDKWYCSVYLYLRPQEITELLDAGNYVLDACKEIVKDSLPCIGSFEVDDIFRLCKILTGDLSRSLKSILQSYRGQKPCFVLRHQLVAIKTGGLAIEPFYAPSLKKMVRDKSEILSENGLNTKSTTSKPKAPKSKPKATPKAKEAIICETNGIKSPRISTQLQVHVENNLIDNCNESKENINLICSFNTAQHKLEFSENLTSSEELSGSSSKHRTPSQSSVQRSLVSDLDFPPVKQSRLDKETKVPSDCGRQGIEKDEDSDSSWKRRFKRNLYQKLPQSAWQNDRRASSAESYIESDSTVSHSDRSSSISSSIQLRRSTRMSKCKTSQSEIASDSDTEEGLKNNSRSARNRRNVEKAEGTATYSPRNSKMPRRKTITSGEPYTDGNRSTKQCSVKKNEPTSSCTAPTTRRMNRVLLKSPSSNGTNSQEEVDDHLSHVDSRTLLSQRKRGRKHQAKSKSNEDTDDSMKSSVESRTPTKIPRVCDKTPKKTPKTSSKTPETKSPITPKTRKTSKTPSRFALTPTMPARASALLTPLSSIDQVRKNLHVSAVPMSLPCRESEYRNIYNFLENKIRDSSGGCMYISGVPGTGKTATVHAVIRSLKEQVNMKKLKDFQYIETNGLRMTEPRQVFVQVLKGLTGQKCTPQQAQDILAERFCTGSAKNKTVVLLVDEVDMLRNRRQDVIYNLFDWPSKPNSHFVVLTIANTMDLPERLLKGRVTSRLGLTRLTFQPYSYKQLQEIVMSRLQGSNSFNDDAVELVARKVAACSGDVRRALDICRRASEVVEDGIPVTMPIINKVLSQMMNSANVCSIKACSRLEKLFLQAVVAENERTGVEETTFISVYRQFQSLCALSSVFLINVSEAMSVLSRLGTSGLLLTEHSRADIHQSIFLNVNADDIHYALNQAAPVS